MGLPIENIVTTLGELNWMFITGEGKKDLNDVFKFQATIRMKVGSPEAVMLANKITAFWEANKPKGAKLKSLGFRDEREKAKEDGSDGDLTGYVIFNFWTGLMWPAKGDTPAKPKVIDIYNAGDRSKGIKPTKIHLGDKKIGNGSMGKISGAMGIYDSGVAARGVTLYISSVQLIKFIEYSEDAGFDAEESGGYQGEDTADEESGFSAPTEEENSKPKPQL